jgi:hypothetical protein
MPSGIEIKETLMKQGGCGLFIYAVFAIQVIGFVYFMIAVIFGSGDPEIKKIRMNCWDRETNRIGSPGVELSEQQRFDIVRRCEVVVKEYLAAKR